MATMQDVYKWLSDRKKQERKRDKLESMQLMDGEIFLGNTTKLNSFPRSHLKSLKTLRLGQQAYDIYGKKLNRRKYKPLIIHETEQDAYNRIMTNLK